MTPPRRQNDEDEKPTAEGVAGERKTPEPAEDKPSFRVDDLRQIGDQVTGYALPDVRAALADLPDSRELDVAAAKGRVSDWLKAPMVIHETPQPERSIR